MHPVEPDSGRGPCAESVAALELAGLLHAGAVGLMPTDTLVALAANPRYAERIWTLKRRPADKPLILMGADLDQLQPVLGRPWRAEWLALAAQGWPGALTLVLPACGPWMEALNPVGQSLGLRIPDCEPARTLLRRAGPLATTSANPSGLPSASDASSARAYFPTLPLLAPLPWPACLGQASTVLAWEGPAQASEGPGRWQVLRAGAFLPEELQP